MTKYSAYDILRKMELGVYDALPKEYRDIVKEFGDTYAVQDAMKMGFTAKNLMETFNQQIAAHMERKLNENLQNN